MKILKFGKGLDTGNVLAGILGEPFRVVELDAAIPPIEQVHDVDVLLLRDLPVPAEIIDAAPKLKLLQRFGQHVMGVDMGHAVKRGIHIARVPSDQTGSTRVVAEHTLFLMLALAKRYKEAAASLEQRKTGAPKTMALFGKTLGMIGVGNTGKELAKLASCLGMRVMAVKRIRSRGLQKELGLDWLGDMSEMDQLIRESDFVSIHLPLTDDTIGFFGTRELGLMKPSSFLINIARGPIVVKDALYEAVLSGAIAGAGLDVFWEEPMDPDDPFLHLNNVIATPHIAGATHETQYRLAEMVAENIRLVSMGLPPRNEITETLTLSFGSIDPVKS